MAKLKEGHSQQLNAAKEKVQRATEELEKIKRTVSETNMNHKKTMSVLEKVKNSNEEL